MSYTRQMYGTKAMRIKHFLVQETGTFDPQYRRPYNASLDAHSHSLIMESVASSKNITAAGLAGVANHFIKPSSTPECLIQVPQGWGMKRLRFMLEIETEDQLGFITTQSVTGYTDHMGISTGNAIDPNMVFFINNINVTRVQTQMTPMGNQQYNSLVDASHVLVNNQYTGISSTNKEYGLRPEDVYVQIDNQVMQAEIENEMLFDSRSLIGTNAKKSRRSNAIAPVYVAGVLDAYRQTNQGNWNSSDSSMLDTAGSTVASDEASADPFLAFLKSKSGMSGTNTFSYGDLITLDANVVNVTHVDHLLQNQRSSLSYQGQSANWASTDYTTQFAAILSQAVPGYMLNYGLNSIHIRSTNLDIGGRITTVFQRKPGSLNRGIDITPHIQAFVYRLETELLKDLCYNGQLGFQLDLKCDLMGETQITISLNGEPNVLYVTPSFCDALMAPMVTNQQKVLGAIAEDFNTLMRDMSENNLVGLSATPNGALGYF